MPAAVDFDHQAIQFYIGCAEHALPSAPLPEFQNAIDGLKAYDASPTDENLRTLKEVHKALRRPKYSYVASEQFRYALVSIIGNVLAGLHSVNLSDTVHFAEAAYLQTREASPWMEASKNANAAFRNECDFHWDLWNRCFQ